MPTIPEHPDLMQPHTCSPGPAPLRAWLRLALAALLLLPLAPTIAAQDVDESLSVAQLEQQAAGLSADGLATLVTAWSARVERLRDQAAAAHAAADDDAGEQQAAALDQHLDAASERLLVLVRALEAAGGEASSARALLLEVRGMDPDSLSVGTLTALGSRWAGRARTWAIDELPGLLLQLLGALLVLFAFKLLAGFTRRVVSRALDAAAIQVTDLLRRFFVGTAGKIVMILGVLFALRTLGVDLGPVLAGVGIVGFVVGFALQDTLANFAAGVMILLYRPFDIGDVIEAAGSTGKVTDLTLVSTTLVTPDNRRITIPNGSIWGGTILNVTANDTRRVDLDVGIGYGDDIEQALRVADEVVRGHPLVLADPAPGFFVANLGASSVDLGLRPWCRTGDYFTVGCDLRKAIKQRFDAEGISLPFPQRDVHLIKDD